MKIFFKSFPELKKFSGDDTQNIDERIEEALYFAPYISLGVQKQMLLNDIISFKEEKGFFPHNGIQFYQEELKQSLCCAILINEDRDYFIVYLFKVEK